MGRCLGRIKGEYMAITRHFECTECNTLGKITIKGDDNTAEDIVYCPICSADIYEEEFDIKDDL